MERGVCASGNKWQQFPLPNQGAGTARGTPPPTQSSNVKLPLYFLSVGKTCDVTGEDISKGLKMAATLLEYPETRGIPIELIDTHSLQCGGANALALSGFSDTQIQKMGRWRGATFKEYIREQLACYSEGMTTKMKRNFKFVNVHERLLRCYKHMCPVGVRICSLTRGYPFRVLCFTNLHNKMPSNE